MIEIKELSFTYAHDEAPVLDRISLVIAEGEHVALIGPNGCGKTTLIKHLNGLLLPGAGDVLVDGMNTKARRGLGEIRRKVGMIFQNPDNQIVGATLEEDVAFGPGNLRLPPDQIRDRVHAALRGVGLAGYAKRHPYSLSGGEKQLLALAGILAMGPKYIVMDEPTSSLDPAARERVHGVIRSLKSRGIAIVQATHAMEEAAAVDRIVVMDKGRVAADNTPSKIFCLVEWLKSLGLAPPPIAELLWRLRARGFDIRPDAFTVEEAAQALAEIAGRPGSAMDGDRQ